MIHYRVLNFQLRFSRLFEINIYSKYLQTDIKFKMLPGKLKLKHFCENVGINFKSFKQQTPFTASLNH
jgi:hypothetical protein